jgi:hypothetical protein
MKQHLQFTTANHIADDEDVAMSTHSKKNASNRKQRKHFFAGFRACVPPTFDTRIDTLCKLINFGDIEPCNIFTVEVSVREGVRIGIGGVRKDR